MRRLLVLILCLILANPVWAGIDFDGTDDYVTMGNPDSMKFGNTTAFSYAVWVKPGTLQGDGTYQGIFGDNYSTNEGWGVFYLNYSGIVLDGFEACYFDGFNFTCRVSDDNVLVEGVWTHFVMTQDTTNTLEGRKMYVNGVEQSGSRCGGTGCDVVATLDYVNTNLTMASRDGAGAGTFWLGNVGEARVYNRELSAAEVLTLYESKMRHGVVNGMISYWTNDEQPGGTAADGDTVHDVVGGVNGTASYGDDFAGCTWADENNISYPPGID